MQAIPLMSNWVTYIINDFKNKHVILNGDITDYSFNTMPIRRFLFLSRICLYFVMPN
jgi:hypothetical protein